MDFEPEEGKSVLSKDSKTSKGLGSIFKAKM